jgi:hypothetical protein
MHRYIGPRGKQPSLYELAVFWKDQEDVPGDWVKFRGIGEPMCFRCGWMPPVDDEQELSKSWRDAGRYLDRAHLADYVITGDNSLRNMIPLCHYPCHRTMPSFNQRDDALDWVATGNGVHPAATGYWQRTTDHPLILLSDRAQMHRLYVHAMARWSQIILEDD